LRVIRVTLSAVLCAGRRPCVAKTHGTARVA
jgi:hypothetical protein